MKQDQPYMWDASKNDGMNDTYTSIHIGIVDLGNLNNTLYMRETSMRCTQIAHQISICPFSEVALNGSNVLKVQHILIMVRIKRHEP